MRERVPESRPEPTQVGEWPSERIIRALENGYNSLRGAYRRMRQFSISVDPPKPPDGDTKPDNRSIDQWR